MHPPLSELRQAMAAHGVTALYIPSGDFHGSEYSGDYFAARAHFSGFTGSAGSLLVFQDWAGLWTDSRYFIQAQEQLSGTGITLMRQGEPSVPSIETYLERHLTQGQVLAFDGRCVSARASLAFQRRLQPLGVSLRTDLDLPGEVWSTRPPLSAEPIWILSDTYAGQSREEKLRTVRDALEKHQADVCLLTALEDIAWLLNLRGGDLPCTPVFLSFFALSKEEATLFVNPAILNEAVQTVLKQASIQVEPYDAFYAYTKALPPRSRLWLDRGRGNVHLLQSLPKDATILDRPSPVEGLKAIKNPTEIQHMRLAHEKDGVALTRFMHWIKTHAGKEPITERSATARLEAFRQEQPHYLGPSFSPIMAYGPHGAIVHYSATEESDAVIKPSGFLLTDTGGHYLEGTTDCTRTFALGPMSPQEKTHYTAVLRGNLNLASAIFPSGCTGTNLDSIARAPLWSLGCDYGHGTGHGVGYLLSVHEGPQGIRKKVLPGDVPFAPGMITSNEPGFYLEGQYGIRLENLILCVSKGEQRSGLFLGFEPLTLVPFDLDAIEPTQMSPRELDALNTYHKLVWEKISPHLSDTEAAWLFAATRPLALGQT